MSELKKCPCCPDGKGKLRAAYDGTYCVQCDKCGLTTLHKFSKQDVVAAWNRRAQPANEPLTLKQPEIVRCKDCTFWTPKPGTWKSWGACSKVAERYTEDSESSMDCDTNYNDFCSYGERKESNEI